MRVPEASVTDSVDGSQGTKLEPLEGQQVPLTIEPFESSTVKIFFIDSLRCSYIITMILVKFTFHTCPQFPSAPPPPLPSPSYFPTSYSPYFVIYAMSMAHMHGDTGKLPGVTCPKEK